MSKMNIITRDFGEVEIEKESIISFPNGIFAFEDLKSFVLLSPLGEDENPMWLQCTESGEPCFIVYEINKLVQDYNPALSDEDKKNIGYEDGDRYQFLAIAVVHDDYKKTTVNLKSPIVLNTTKSIAAQIIVDEDYQLRFPIFEKGEEK